MDYCSTCRRTLNGVFVCPGCGAYSPDIAPAGSHVHHTPSTVAVMAEISHTREFDAFPGFPEPEAHVPVAPSAPSATGRAARRRRLADWKKQRRRAVVASTVALVGGGLTLAFMPSSRPSVAQAHASTPDPSRAATLPSVGGADSNTEKQRPHTGDIGTPDSGTRPSDSANAPGSATATAPVDAPAKRKTSPQTTTGDARPTAEAQPESPSTAAPAVPDDPPPPAAEQPTAQPNQPTSPAQPPPPPPPTAEPPEDDSSELCVLVICLGLNGNK
ncbi:SCO2400 family protein [Streptomyces niveus]|uniref:SCO2400 family protein n=1 Tax=Streptomyces niveus TaxID=193462 RepID=UPI003F53FF26